MRLAAVLSLALCSTQAWALDVAVDVQRDRRAISPLIYGVVLGTPEQARRMGVTLRRHGGNALSRYNYLATTTNEGGDGSFFKNLVLTPPSGRSNSADGFVDQSKDAGTESVIELPMIGWVSKANSLQSAPYDCSFSVARYGPQRSTDPLDPDCGDGFLVDGGFVQLNDPLDTSITADVGFARGWVQHLVATHGSADGGGVRYYNLGNQPALWWSTHHDVHPAPASYAELKEKLEQYGSMVKSVDPGAKTLGPSEWGWLAYHDTATQERSTYGLDFVAFYLRQARAWEVATGQRILDYFDLHIYPQAFVGQFNGTDPATNAVRLRSTRVLWDPSYTVESWEVCCYSPQQQILPRMRAWAADSYPGIPLSVGSYHWGALHHINGALTQVELLGLFGREGVSLAAVDPPPPDGAIGEDAFKLFRDYDGAGRKFGSTSIRARSADVSQLGAFAAYTQGTVTVVLVNKDPVGSAVASLTFAGTSNTGPWRAFAFSGTSRLAPSGSGAADGGAVVRVLPPYSAELLEFIPLSGIPAQELFDAPDAGEDGGAPDAGPADAGEDGGGVGGGGGSGGGGGGAPPKTFCGCGAGGPLVPLVGLALLVAALRRSRRRPTA